jgi:hypothetical protein
VTQLHWDDATAKLGHSGAAAWEGGDSIVEIAGH